MIFKRPGSKFWHIRVKFRGRVYQESTQTVSRNPNPLS